jgi:N6-adenosine-specific RNA methylase IME4
VSVFADLPRNHFGAIYADPPWSFRVWSKDTGNGRSAESHYSTMSMEDLAGLPVAELAAPDCVLFMWACWPSLPEALGIIESWGFTYKTCGFDWLKADARQPDMFRDSTPGQAQTPPGRRSHGHHRTSPAAQPQA